jgi:C-terminal peptidase prc
MKDGAMRRFLLLALVVLVVSTAASEASAHDDRAQAFARRVLSVADLVLAQHVDPPVRQQLVLQALRELAREAGDARPVGLGERVSKLSSSEEFRDVLLEFWNKARAKSQLSSDDLEARVLARMLSAAPGEARLALAKEYAVEQQFAANQYVGTGIALSIEDGTPMMREVFDGGPAHQAGARSGDLIEQIDGLATAGKPLKEIVDLLRGPEGSEVTVVLRQPDEEQPRTCTIVRGEVVVKTVVHKHVQEEGQPPVGYVRIVRISASTPHELRRVERVLHGIEGLTVDLRSLGGDDLHHAVLLADAWLDGGPIGRVRTRDGIKEVEAAPDCVFRSLPLVVLVDPATSGAAEWLAAALRDRRQATIVGAQTSGNAYVASAAPVAESDQVLVLATGMLERAGGEPLVRPADLPFAALPEIHVARAGESENGSSDPAFSWGVRPNQLLAADGHPVSDEQWMQRSFEILREKIRAANEP